MGLHLDGQLVPVEDLVKTPAVRNLIKEAIKDVVRNAKSIIEKEAAK